MVAQTDTLKWPITPRNKDGESDRWTAGRSRSEYIILKSCNEQWTKGQKRRHRSKEILTRGGLRQRGQRTFREDGNQKLQPSVASQVAILRHFDSVSHLQIRFLFTEKKKKVERKKGRKRNSKIHTAMPTKENLLWGVQLCMKSWWHRVVYNPLSHSISWRLKLFLPISYLSHKVHHPPLLFVHLFTLVPNSPIF